MVRVSDGRPGQSCAFPYILNFGLVHIYGPVRQFYTLKGTVTLLFFFHIKLTFDVYIHVCLVVKQIWSMKCLQITKKYVFIAVETRAQIFLLL